MHFRRVGGGEDGVREKEHGLPDIIELNKADNQRGELGRQDFGMQPHFGGIWKFEDHKERQLKQIWEIFKILFKS